MRQSKQVKRTSFRLKQESHDMILKKAEEAGMTTRQWLEKAILNNRTKIVERRKPNSADLGRLVMQINRMGNNINQVAHKLNTAQVTGTLTRDDCLDAIARLDQIRALLNETISYARQNGSTNTRSRP